MENIILDGHEINLGFLSMDELKEILEKINNNEEQIKNDIENVLKELT